MQPNTIAHDDLLIMTTKDSYRFNISQNDTDYDGLIDISSINIVTPAQLGQVLIHSNGEVTYEPGIDFVQRDTFSYTIQDDDGAVSASAHVELIYNPAPILSASNASHSSIELSWSDETEETQFIIQQRY